MEEKGECLSDSETRILLLSEEDPLDSSENGNYSDSMLGVKEPVVPNTDSWPCMHGKKPILRVYKRRWLILGIFSLLSLMQCTVWNTWGPITESSLIAFPSWNATTIALFGNWGTITYVLFTVPLIWLCDSYGLRIAVVVSALLMACGTAIRCISVNETFFTWMAHLGANLNGIAGVVLCAAPPALSSLWFPPNERTTATGISNMFNQLGNAGGFLLGPLLVREPFASNTSSLPPSNVIYQLRNDISILMDTEALICAILLFCVVLYFPPKPSLPPSMASTVQRLNIRDGVHHILRNREVMLLTIASSLSQGILGVWLGVMNVMMEMNANFERIGLNQSQSGWLGFWAIVASCLLSLIIARLTDCLAGHMKVTITILLTIATVAFTVLAMMGLALTEPSVSLLYITVIVGSCANYAATPLFMELAAEVAFPVDETIVGGFMSCAYNLVGALFLFAFFIPNIGFTWMNYCLAAAPAISLPFVFMTNEEYRRSDLDKNANKDKSLLINAAMLDDEI